MKMDWLEKIWTKMGLNMTILTRQKDLPSYGLILGGEKGNPVN